MCDEKNSKTMEEKKVSSFDGKSEEKKKLFVIQQ